MLLLLHIVVRETRYSMQIVVVLISKKRTLLLQRHRPKLYSIILYKNAILKLLYHTITFF